MSDLQTEKYLVIEALTKVDDIKLIQKIKDILSHDKEIAGYHANGEPLTKANILARAQAANKAINEGKVKTLQQVKEESKNW